MGRPDTDPEQIQAEYELHPQEYDPTHEPTPNVADEYPPPPPYENSNQQGQQQPQFPPQQPPQYPPPAQQQPPKYPPPTQQQPPQYPLTAQQQPLQYPPPSQQPNQAYPPPQRPAPYPPQQNMQYNPAYPNGTNQQPAAAAYTPQPVQYPPKSPAANQMYANVGPQATQPQTVYAPNVAPQMFPQTAFLPPDQGQGMPPVSPHKHVAGIPVGNGGVDGWRTGLFDFMDDPMNALVTAFFPCLTFGQIAEIVDDGHTTCGTSGLLYGAIAFLIGLPCLMSCTYRTKLRNKFGLPEAPAPDWVTHFLCEWCALCQEYRELQLRGWDPSIGWQGNLAKKQVQQPVMMVPMNQRMMA
ncbi:hypothetical protein J1N35_020272 [Gossypium stocksii]|uniref:Uncharacterized protein n=1 Tax=Gossypium stocksii TaxID=47602 RepID=A0A9D3ZZ34_9ROSI|nr:hypothetical protein J1N35_020272 [Gossypium stocksii]